LDALRILDEERGGVGTETTGEVPWDDGNEPTWDGPGPFDEPSGSNIEIEVSEPSSEGIDPLDGATDAERLLRALAESELLVAAGDMASAQRVLKKAHGIAPDDDDVRRRLMNVNEAIDASSANALLERALRGAPNGAELARRAVQLRPVRDVLLRSLGVFARAGAHDDIADVAEQLVELDPNDQGALRTLFDANMAMHSYKTAIEAAQALLKLRPDDLQLRAQLQKAQQALAARKV
jgi:tetratricopeptide (TPR) repeat protein